MDIVANPGSTLGEAVGALIEIEMLKILRSVVAENKDYKLEEPTFPDLRQGKQKKRKLEDAAGNKWQIDAYVIDQNSNPIVLIESKYLRYTKHNRDKASWVCTAHGSLRRKHQSIRKSIVLLAGRWSKETRKIFEANGIKLIDIPFEKIVEVLKEKPYSIDYEWGEKNRDMATAALRRWRQLGERGLNHYDEIGKKLLDGKEQELRHALREALDTTKHREIIEVETVIKTSRGESRLYVHDSTEEARMFFSSFQPEEIWRDDKGA